MLPSEDVVYTVQVREPESPDDAPVWVDVATVKVPPKTKRRTALVRGLDEAGIKLSPELKARALDFESAYVWEARPPEPKGLRLT